MMKNINEIKEMLNAFYEGITTQEEENQLKAAMFKVRSTDANLKQVISNSQFHFGYVYLQEN